MRLATMDPAARTVRKWSRPMATSNVDSPISIQKHLKGIQFPASKQELIETARKNGAPDDVLGMIQRLPQEQYKDAPNVAEAFGKVH